MGKTCKSMANSCQCMTKTTTIKKNLKNRKKSKGEKKEKKRKRQATDPAVFLVTLVIAVDHVEKEIFRLKHFLNFQVYSEPGTMILFANRIFEDVCPTELGWILNQMTDL